VLGSTILADAVAAQDTITQLVVAIRRVCRLVPRAREAKLRAHDYDRPGKPDCAPDDPQATQALVAGLVNDALTLLEAIGDAGLDAEQAEAVALLALVAGQDVEPGQRPGSWRIARRVARDRVISTVDGRPASPAGARTETSWCALSPLAVGTRVLWRRGGGRWSRLGHARRRRSGRPRRGRPAAGGRRGRRRGG
jgi:hypothetical protein